MGRPLWCHLTQECCSVSAVRLRYCILMPYFQVCVSAHRAAYLAAPSTRCTVMQSAFKTPRGTSRACRDWLGARARRGTESRLRGDTADGWYDVSLREAARVSGWLQAVSRGQEGLWELENLNSAALNNTDRVG